jgi:hypothetical protein
MKLRQTVWVVLWFICFLCVVLSSGNAQTWPNFKTVELYSMPGSESTSIAIDSQGRPHIAFYDVRDPGTTRIMYTRYDGKQWYTEHVDTSGQYLGQRISLALDLDDTPNIAYVDVRNTGSSLWHVYRNSEGTLIRSRG